ncbi:MULTISPECIES: hypothetical protein [unclassified Providencia]|uniref:hypothetical protein n=1 Tax=unclassified Providencia TaxID=2633465 RepID=UPI00234A85FA|nr:MULTISPECIES: hypothetical protein [unclassified Providencia]
MKFNNILKTILIAMVIILFLSPIAFYIYFFHEFGISSTNSNWGSFGSYLSGIFSLFTAVFTFLSVIILINTFKKTIEFNQIQIKIAQEESELNNFNFIINLIHKNIKENSTLTKENNYDGEEVMNNKFSSVIPFAIQKSNTNPIGNFNPRLYSAMVNDVDLRSNINKYAKSYVAITDYSYLNHIYPLVKSLCIKLVNCKDPNQKSMLEDILKSAIDENILFWSLALIKDERFDFLMIMPSKLRKLFN